MKKTLRILLLGLFAASSMSLTSCKDDLIDIGILQVMTHDALNGARDGFIEQLKEEGFVEGENIRISKNAAEGDTATENSMATKLATSSDLVFGISTSSALALKSAVSDAEKETPVLYSAVTDPIGAGLIKSVTDHGNIVGTSDAGPTSKNIALFKEFAGITKIGILYNQAEPNSQVQKKECQKACDDLGLTLVDGGVTASNEIFSSLSGMIGEGIKGLFVPTDNLIASSMQALKETLIENKIVTVCADKASTDKGGTLGYSVDYTLLGKTTGKMAVRILKGEKISSITCSLSDSFPLEINEEFFTKTGLSLPDSLAKDKKI